MLLAVVLKPEGLSLSATLMKCAVMALSLSSSFQGHHLFEHATGVHQDGGSSRRDILSSGATTISQALHLLAAELPVLQLRPHQVVRPLFTGHSLPSQRETGAIQQKDNSDETA